MEFKVGDRVRIRSWEDMEREYGLDADGNIETPFADSFIREMKHLCGRTAKITDIFGFEVALRFDEDYGNENWNYTYYMIEPETACSRISPIYYNADADRYYRDVDGIRLAYEAYETHGSRHCGRLIGWYWPGEKETESPQRIYEREAYAQMLRGMIE